MPDRYIESHIRQIPKFANMPAEHLKWVIEGFRVFRVEPGETLFNQGEPTRGMYMFVNGHAELIHADEHGHERLLGTVGPNQYLNEAALYRPGVETATLRVRDTATVLFLARTVLQNIVTHHPEVKAELPVPVAAKFDEGQREDQAQVFKGQRDNEKILLSTRRHWWAWVRRTWLPVVIMLSILVLSSFLPGILAIALDGLAIVLGGGWSLYMYLEWRNDHVIISDQRVVRIEQNIIRFSSHVSEVPLRSIQAVNADYVTSDPFSRVFDYGTVEIRTAGDAGNMTLNVIPDPEMIQELIFNNRNTIAASAEKQHRNAIRAEIDKALGMHDPRNEEGNTVTSPKGALKRGFTPFQTAFVDANGNSIYRKHLAFLTRRFIVPGLLILVGIGVFFGGLIAGMGLIASLVGLLLVIVGAAWCYWVDWDWRHDFYLVGDELIQLVHRRPLFLQNEDDTILLDRVDNVVSQKEGFIESMLNYGDVVISLIGSDQGDRKRFRSVPNPQSIQAEITRRQARLRAKESEADERRRREEIAEYLSVYHETINTERRPPPTVSDPNVVVDPYTYGANPEPPPYSNAPPAQGQPPRPNQPRVDPSLAPDPPPRRGGMRPPNVPRRRKYD